MRTQLATTTNYSDAAGERDSVRRDRLISCRDVGDRRREVIVFTDLAAARVVLVAPPGETAYLDLPDARQLRATLDDLIADAEHELAMARAAEAAAAGAAAAAWTPAGPLAGVDQSRGMVETMPDSAPGGGSPSRPRPCGSGLP